MVLQPLSQRRRHRRLAASPARAKTLAGLPPAYVLVAGGDPLRDEGNEYAERLKEAGVPVTYRFFPGQFHGFFTMGKLLQPGQYRGERNRRLAEGAELTDRVEDPACCVFGIPVDFILFALTLLGVALFHHHTLPVALTGLAAIIVYKLIFTGFKFGAGLGGLGHHMAHEWVTLANLFLLLMGFALLSRHFEESRIPDEMPALLPDDWKGGLVLLVLVFVLSSFLDNIAAALIGGTVARHVFQGKVHIGYLAAIVAASNAGGSGSVVGDTTTTMMWIAGVSPLAVVEAYIAAVVAMLIFAVPASLQQHRYSPIVKNPPTA